MPLVFIKILKTWSPVDSSTPLEYGKVIDKSRNMGFAA